MEPSSKQHFLSLDALRGVAAISVMLFHIFGDFGIARLDLLPHAYLGVDFFFLLSGFVIAYSYDQRIVGGMSWVKFMGIRLRRLYPLMFAGVCIGLSYFLLQDHFQPWRVQQQSLLFLATCFALLLLPYFPLALNGVSWSLLFELIANTIYAMLGRRLRAILLITIIGLSFAMLTVLASLSRWNGVPVQTLGFWSGVTEYVSIGVARSGFGFFAGVFLYRYCFQRSSVSRWWGHPFIMGALLLAIFCAPARWSAFYNLFITVCVFPAVVLAWRTTSRRVESRAYLLSEDGSHFQFTLSTFQLRSWQEGA